MAGVSRLGIESELIDRADPLLSLIDDCRPADHERLHLRLVHPIARLAPRH